MSELSVWEKASAIGAPLGLEVTLTEGIISRKLEQRPVAIIAREKEVRRLEEAQARRLRDLDELQPAEVESAEGRAETIGLAEGLPVPGDPRSLLRLRDLTLTFTPGRQEVGPAPHAVPPPPLPLAPKPEPVDEGALERFALEIGSRLGKLVQERGDYYAYPRSAREQRLQGTVQVAVQFGADGKVIQMFVAESSGHAVLDQRAVEMVREVLPTVPRELQSRDFTVRLPMVFKLRSIDEALERFALDIQRRVSKLVEERGERVYPREARARKWEGITQIAIEFSENGQLQQISVATSSGYAVLDQRAVEMVREVLPTVPRELQSSDFTVRLPIVFKLKEKSWWMRRYH
jgi:TonB family protein